MKNDNLNYKDLNEAIGTGNKILKLSYAFLILALVAGGLYILRVLDVFPLIGTILKVMVPFFIGFILAWLLNPIVNKLTDKGMKRSLAVGLVYLMLAVIIYLFCLAVIPSLVTQLNEFAKSIPGYIDSISDWVNNVFTKLSRSTNIDMDTVKINFITYVETFGTGIATNLPSNLISVVQSVVSGIGKFFIGVLIGFYLSLNFHNVNKLMMSIVPVKFKKDAEYLLGSISDVLYRFLNGTLWLTVLLFVVSFIGFSIIGLSTPILFALFCAITNLIPYVGPYIGAVPAILVGYSQSTFIGTAVLIFIVICQTIDGNILNPIVIGKKTDLSPITVIISMLIFEYFFGIIGMIIATPVAAIIKVIYVFFDEKYNFFGYAKDKSVKKEISKVKLSK